MFNQLIFILIGLVIGSWVVWLLMRNRNQLVNPSFDEAEKNRGKIREYLQSQNRISNDDVEKLLGVSDSTATRYLDDLEKEGLLRQVGRSGPSVYYEKT